MAGRVMRRKVCHELAPSVLAACSCSSPISCRTGTTSRTTNGTVTKIVASTIPGSAKMIWNPFALSQSPNHPVSLYTRSSESPMTTGEIANGRSMIALISALPRNSVRTRSSAQPTPKIVLKGIAISVPRPCSKARKKIIPSGISRSSPRYPSAKLRRPHLLRRPLASMTKTPLREAAEDEQDDQRDRQQHHGLRGGPGQVAGANLAEDQARHDLGLERDESREQDKRPELADRPGERQRGAGEDRGEQTGQDDAAEGRERAGAQ